MTRRTSLIAVLALTLLLGYGSQVWAQAGTKAEKITVGYVELQAVLESYQPYRDAMKELQKYTENLQEKISSEQEKLQKMRQQMKDNQFLSQDEQKKKQQELMQKLQTYRQRAKRSEQMVKRKRQELLEPVLKAVQVAVRRTGENNGLDVIHRVDTGRSGDVLWVSDRVDITQKVISKLDELEAEKASSSSTEPSD